MKANLYKVDGTPIDGVVVKSKSNEERGITIFHFPQYSDQGFRANIPSPQVTPIQPTVMLDPSLYRLVSPIRNIRGLQAVVYYDITRDGYILVDDVSPYLVGSVYVGPAIIEVSVIVLSTNTSDVDNQFIPHISGNITTVADKNTTDLPLVTMLRVPGYYGKSTMNTGIMFSGGETYIETTDMVPMEVLDVSTLYSGDAISPAACILNMSKHKLVPTNPTTYTSGLFIPIPF